MRTRMTDNVRNALTRQLVSIARDATAESFSYELATLANEKHLNAFSLLQAFIHAADFEKAPFLIRDVYTELLSMTNWPMFSEDDFPQEPEIIDVGMYPLELCRYFCEEYIKSLPWDDISKDVMENGICVCDISDCISSFPHLELDNDYRLICYVRQTYNGLWGRVVALSKSDSDAPIRIEDDGEYALRMPYPMFQLPEKAANPMEAVYHDGSPAGYLEAMLFENFLNGIPYARNENDTWDWCITVRPDGYQQRWLEYIDVGNWNPKVIRYSCDTVALNSVWRHFENGIGDSTGRDTISLRSDSFVNDIGLYHCRQQERKEGNIATGFIEDAYRYSPGRCCCVTECSTITIAYELTRYMRAVCGIAQWNRCGHPIREKKQKTGSRRKIHAILFQRNHIQRL